MRRREAEVEVGAENTRKVAPITREALVIRAVQTTRVALLTRATLNIKVALVIRAVLIIKVVAHVIEAVLIIRVVLAAKIDSRAIKIDKRGIAMVMKNQGESRKMRIQTR